MLKGKVWKPIEISFASEEKYKDAFNEIDMDVTVSDGKGKTWKVPAFWAGGDTWKIRFSAPEPGIYTYETTCTNAADKGLNGQKG